MKLVTESKVIINKENFVSLKNPKCRTELKRAFGKELQNLHKQSPEKKTESSTRKKTEKTQKEKEKVRTRANTEGVRVTQYESIIFNFLKEKQKLKQKDSNYLSKQKDINEIMRSILVDWLVDVTEKFQMNPQTLFMSIDLLDRYLSLKEISRSKLQLLGICCLMIVGKYEEIYPPLLKDYLSVCDNAFQRNEILAMEAEILVTVQLLSFF
jgi:cyclin B